MIRFQSNESRTKASLGFLEITPLPLFNRPICRVGNRHESFLIMLLNEIVIGLASPSIVENRARHISFPHGPFNGERGEGTTREIRGREREKKKRTGNGGRGERARFNAISRYNGDTSDRAPITMLLSSPRFVSARASCAVACVACHTCARVLLAFIASLSATIPPPGKTETFLPYLNEEERNETKDRKGRNR